MVVVVVVGREEGFELLRRGASNLTMLVLILEYYQLNQIRARRGAPALQESSVVNFSTEILSN